MLKIVELTTSRFRLHVLILTVLVLLGAGCAQQPQTDNSANTTDQIQPLNTVSTTPRPATSSNFAPSTPTPTQTPTSSGSTGTPPSSTPSTPSNPSSDPIFVDTSPKCDFYKDQIPLNKGGDQGDLKNGSLVSQIKCPSGTYNQFSWDALNNGNAWIQCYSPFDGGTFINADVSRINSHTVLASCYDLYAKYTWNYLHHYWYTGNITLFYGIRCCKPAL